MSSSFNPKTFKWPGVLTRGGLKAGELCNVVRGTSLGAIMTQMPDGRILVTSEKMMFFVDPKEKK